MFHGVPVVRVEPHPRDGIAGRWTATGSRGDENPVGARHAAGCAGGEAAGPSGAATCAASNALDPRHHCHRSHEPAYRGRLGDGAAHRRGVCRHATSDRAASFRSHRQGRPRAPAADAAGTVVCCGPRARVPARKRVAGERGDAERQARQGWIDHGHRSGRRHQGSGCGRPRRDRWRGLLARRLAGAPRAQRGALGRQGGLPARGRCARARQRHRSRARLPPGNAHRCARGSTPRAVPVPRAHAVRHRARRGRQASRWRTSPPLHQGWSSTPPPVEPTDVNGHFTVAGVQPGEYWIVAREGARAPGLAQVVVRERDDAAVELTVGEGGFITGRTVDDGGRPIAGASIRAEAFDGRGLPQLVSDSLAGTSRADGIFVLGPLPVGALSLAVSHQGHATQRVSATVAALRSFDVQDVVLESGLAIRGEVRDREGAGLTGVLVRAEARLGGDGPSAETESDASGAFALSGLSAGVYSVSAATDGLRAWPRECDSGRRAGEDRPRLGCNHRRPSGGLRRATRPWRNGDRRVGERRVAYGPQVLLREDRRGRRRAVHSP